MSGGSFNYLYNKEVDELFGYEALMDLESMEAILLNKNYQDLAQDVRRLIEYIKSAKNRVGVLHENLKPVLKAVEWYESCDYDEDDLAKYIEEYRRGEAKKNEGL